MIWSALRRLIQRYGFFKREPVEMAAFHESMRNWNSDPFYTEEKRKNERLAAIASEIAALNVKRLKAKEQKKNQKVFEDQMTALMAERLRIETGKDVAQ